jgi:hypothetical protein
MFQADRKKLTKEKQKNKKCHLEKRKHSFTECVVNPGIVEEKWYEETGKYSTC